ncbi:hypothetical protein I316_01151 [Kwoniella heveanensis BCC8398]|uniref:Smr domain-containing protein n=1 Tax=Kwoniella heveanensis BCC8398 TaxID=1296120 RepID=A0A1B9H1U7_9TREE|nr:hypothetical protein I316_01151 [Kwoniella heveanensis BCC8398]
MGGNGRKQVMDPAVLAAVLSADFPLVDSALIEAMVNDHPPESLASEESSIRDQLGILEATMVPDPDDGMTVHSPNPSWTDSTSDSMNGNGIDELSNKLESLATNSNDSINRGRTKGTGTGTGTSSTSASASAWSAEDGTEKRRPFSEEDDAVGLLDELELLRTLFPAIAERELQSALASSVSLQAAIDQLLSFELIRDVEAQGHWPGEESGTDKESWEEISAKMQARSKSKTKSKSKPASQASSRVPSISTTPVIPSSPHMENALLLSPSSAHSRGSTIGSTSSKKKAKKDKTVIPLVDTMQRRATPAQSRSASASASRGRSASPPRAGPSNNAWHNITSVSSFLADLLPYPATYFLKYLHSPVYRSAYSAVKGALAALPSNATADDGPSRKVLEDMYEVSLSDGQIGKRQIRSDLEVCVHAAGEDVATVMDLMDLLSDISEWPGDDDFFEPRPEFVLNKQPKLTSMTTPHQTSSQPVIAVDMARTVSNASTVSNGSSILAPTHPTTTLPADSVSNGITIINGNALPGKMTRPQPKTKAKKAEPEIVLSGGAIREAKLREVPGSKPSPAINSNLPALNPLEVTSPLMPSSPKLRSVKIGNHPQVHPQNWRTVSHARRPPGAATSSRTTMRKLTVEECQARAALERARRETAIRAAGSHFKYSTTGLPGGNRSVKATISGHYAAQAKEAAERAREWDLRAARLVVESHLGTTTRSSGVGVGSSTGSTPYTNGGGARANGGAGAGAGAGAGTGGGVGAGGNKTIDLHHMTVNEAITVVSEIIEPWWAAEKEARAERWKAREEGKMVIVTGVGRHSVGNKGVLGPAVSGFLDKEGWRIERGDSERGFLVVWGRK